MAVSAGQSKKNFTVNSGCNVSEKIFRTKIFGKEYPLTGDLDPSLVDEVAKLVNEKMQALAKELPIGSSQKVAILTCLNLALELVILKRDKAKPDPEMEKKLQSLIEIIDQLQAQAATR